MRSSHSGPCPALKLATVVGSSSSDEAKIGGMTPEVLSLSGRCEDLPLEHAVADLPFGILDQQAALRALHEYDEGDHGDRHHDHREDQTGRQRALAAELQRAGDRDGSSATMPEKMISEMPLPMPREVICSPSHIRNMVPPVSVITVEMRKNSPGSVTT